MKKLLKKEKVLIIFAKELKMEIYQKTKGEDMGLQKIKKDKQKYDKWFTNHSIDK